MTQAVTPSSTLGTDSGRYVYGVVRSNEGMDAVDDLAGATGEALLLVQDRELAAVVEAVPEADVVPASRFVRAHARVLDAVASRCSVLPLRFGTVLESEDAVVEEVLAQDQEWLLARLDHLEGRVQLILRARYVLDTVLAEVVGGHPEVRALRERTRDLPEDAATPERIRLGELVSQAVEAKRTADRDVLLDALQPQVVDSSVRHSGDLDGLLDLAVLVDARHVADLEDHARATAQRMAGRVNLQLIGPMAPYDFASDGV